MNKEQEPVNFDRYVAERDMARRFRRGVRTGMALITAGVAVYLGSMADLAVRRINPDEIGLLHSGQISREDYHPLPSNDLMRDYFDLTVGRLTGALLIVAGASLALKKGPHNQVLQVS